MAPLLFRPAAVVVLTIPMVVASQAHRTKRLILANEQLPSVVASRTRLILSGRFIPARRLTTSGGLHVPGVLPEKL